MHILVTGGAGFIGRNLCRALRDEGHVCTAVDNLSVAPSVDLDAPIDSRDVVELTADDLDQYDTVVHLAALKSVPQSFRDPAQLAHNVTRDQHVLRIFAASRKPTRLFLASSCEVYGEREIKLHESLTHRPRSPYAVGKCTTELLADVYRSLNPSKQISALRFFNVFGPDEGPDALVPAFIQSALQAGSIVIEGDGDQCRDLSFIDDVVAVLLRMITSEGTLPSVVNVGSGVATSVNAIARWITEMVPGTQTEHAPMRPNEINSFVADTRLCAKLFPVESWTPVRDGLKQSLEAYRRSTATTGAKTS